MNRTRLDSLLTERGLYPSRSQAAAAILAGEVLIGKGRRLATKPSQMIEEGEELIVERGPEFVSRGGVKLANALDTLQVDPTGALCLDVGAATGGFTDCLLKRGAASVTTYDVAYGELAWSLRQHPNVIVNERMNARAMERSDLTYSPNLIVIDVSFISLKKVLAPVLACADEQFDCLALVKPQFEVGKARVGKGGVVSDPLLRRGALVDIAQFVIDGGYGVQAFASSGLPGPAGNRETFIRITEPARPGAVTDIEMAAAQIEPE